MENPTSSRPTRRLGVAAAMVAGGVLAGAALATTWSANAESTPSPSTGSSTAPSQRLDRGPDPVRSDEKRLTGADADKARAAALAAVPGGTIYRLETDAGDGVYEAHMTKADGTPVTVKLDKNFKLVKVEDGMGVGDPAPAGGRGHHGGGPGAPDSSPSGTSSSGNA